MNKAECRDKMEQGRFLPVTEELFQLYNIYEKECQEDQDQEGLLWLFFFRGETYFRVGKYQQALDALNQCVLQQDKNTSFELMENCYNILGLIYYTMGYEVLSMQNYLRAIAIATANKDYRRRIIIQINIGWLYRDLGDYEKALQYYLKNMADLSLIKSQNEYDLEELCLCYIANLYFDVGRNEEAVDILHKIEEHNLQKSDIFYEASQLNTKIKGYYYLHDQEKFQKNIDLLVERAGDESDFLEFCESYLDICQYVIKIDEKGAERLIEVLRKNCDKTEIPFFDMRIKRMELEFARKYRSRESYLERCSEYIDCHSRYEKFDKIATAENLAFVEKLDKMNAEKERYREKSRIDLMTRILNKISFGEAVTEFMEQYEPSQLAAMAVIDIDSFKEVNDSNGHIMGDTVLKGLSEMMKEVFDEDTVIGRVGGDEFAAFWTNVQDRDHILEQLDKLHEMIRQKIWKVDDREIHISISVGVQFVTTKSTYEKIFRMADVALYQAKDAGKDRTVVA